MKYDDTGKMNIGGTTLVAVLSPENIQQLAQEIHKHPDLLAHLREQESPDIYVWLIDIAAFLGIVVDGAYTGMDMDHLAGIMLKQLTERRTGLVFLQGNSTVN